MCHMRSSRDTTVSFARSTFNSAIEIEYSIWDVLEHPWLGKHAIVAANERRETGQVNGYSASQ